MMVMVTQLCDDNKDHLNMPFVGELYLSEAVGKQQRKQRRGGLWDPHNEGEKEESGEILGSFKMKEK